jgi:hypothetical protein
LAHKATCLSCPGQRRARASRCFITALSPLLPFPARHGACRHVPCRARRGRGPRAAARRAAGARAVRRAARAGGHPAAGGQARAQGGAQRAGALQDAGHVSPEGRPELPGPHPRRAMTRPCSLPKLQPLNAPCCPAHTLPTCSHPVPVTPTRSPQDTSITSCPASPPSPTAPTSRASRSTSWRASWTPPSAWRRWQTCARRGGAEGWRVLPCCRAALACRTPAWHVRPATTSAQLTLRSCPNSPFPLRAAPVASSASRTTCRSPRTPRAAPPSCCTTCRRWGCTRRARRCWCPPLSRVVRGRAGEERREAHPF